MEIDLKQPTSKLLAATFCVIFYTCIVFLDISSVVFQWTFPRDFHSTDQGTKTIPLVFDYSVCFSEFGCFSNVRVDDFFLSRRKILSKKKERNCLRSFQYAIS
jgi:hypothetical protein